MDIDIDISKKQVQAITISVMAIAIVLLMVYDFKNSGRIQQILIKLLAAKVGIESLYLTGKFIKERV